MKRRLDWQLIIPSLLLAIFGLTALTSISVSLAVSQLIYLFVGIAMFILFSRFDYQIHYLLAKLYALGSLLLLLLPFLFGAVTRGAVRWLQIGSLTLQPSELIKPFLIIIFAGFLSSKPSFSQIKRLIISILLLAIPVLLIFKQPDLGSTLVVVVIWLAILFASYIPKAYWLGLTALTLIVGPIGWRFLADYQKQRLITFLNPYADPRGAGYHMLQSIIAVGSGGLLGRGLGSGVQSQLRFLPENHTDFIFASIAEELGFIGAVSLILIYFYLLKRIFNLSQNAPDKFSQLLTIGVFAMLFFQATVNIGMNLGLLPITGITLPLVSSGGSSILATMISLGIVHNISLHQQRKSSLEIK